MDCTLMHKNIPVVEMQLDETGYIAKLRNAQDIRHLPLGIHVAKTGIDRKTLNDWWVGRSIPASRDGLRDALESLEIGNPTYLLSKCYGLSLSDQYWICPKDSGLRWETVNFFHNDFSKDVGEILFGHQPADPAHVSLISPDNTSDGWLRKKWIIADGKRYLMKGGSGVYQQEPFNEVVASAIMRRLDIPHVAYTLTHENGKPYSLCENFVTPDTELVPAWRVRESVKRDNRHSGYTHLLRCCDSLGIPGVRAALDRMLTLDYIIANEDRHYNNFGFIRNAETLEWLGVAPVFDSGTSLWHNTPFMTQDISSKPFRASHAEQIKLVADLSWFDFSALDGLTDEITSIFQPSDRMDDTRKMLIAGTVMERCERIEALSRNRTPSILDNLHDMQRQIEDTSREPSGKKRETEIT